MVSVRKPAGLPGRNDPCPCGGGLKFKKCHGRVEDEIHAGPSRYRGLSLKELALEEIRSFKEIFGVQLTGESLVVRERIHDSDVQLFFERVRNLWNSSPPLVDRLPRADDLRYRALYFGTPDMFTTVNLIARYCLYCDQIVVIDPFGWFREFSAGSSHSMYREPQAWVRQIIRNGVYLCSLENWIRSGLVEVTAFPLTLSDPLRVQHIETMKSKLDAVSDEHWDASVEELSEDLLRNTIPEELEAWRPPHADSVKDLRKSLDAPEVLAQIQHDMPGVTKDELLKVLQNVEKRNNQIDKIREEMKREPRRYKWATHRAFEDQMSTSGAGMNLEDAKWLAETTGSHFITDKRTLWNAIVADLQTGEAASADVTSALTKLAEAFARLTFKFLNDVPLEFVLQIRQEARLEGFRSLIRDFWNQVRTEGLSETDRLAAIKHFQEKLAAGYEQYKREFEEIEKSVYSKVAFAGVSGAGAIISGSLQLGMLSVGLWVTAYDKELKRQTKKSEPFSVFMDLERM